MVKAVLDLKERNTVLVSYELPEKEITIGRSRDNLISIADKSISRHHALIIATDDGFKIKDLGSLNGIFINDMKIKEALLRNGDNIELGKVTLIFRLLKPIVTPAPEKSPALEETAGMEETAERPEREVTPDPNLLPEISSDDFEAVVDESLHLKEEVAPIADSLEDLSEQNLNAHLELLDRDKLFFLLKLSGKIDNTTDDKFERILSNIFAAGSVDVILSFEELEEINEKGWNIIRSFNESIQSDGKIIAISHCNDSLSREVRENSDGWMFQFFNTSDEALRFFNERTNDVGPVVDHVRDTIIPAVSEEVPEEPDDAIAPPPETLHLSLTADENIKIENEIKGIIKENPFFSIGKIRRELRDPMHGGHNIGFFKIRKILKDMDLNTPHKRYEFYEECRDK